MSQRGSHAKPSIFNLDQALQFVWREYGCRRGKKPLPGNRLDSIMCLAIPMQIIEIDGLTARCSANGIAREVSLYLLARESVVPGDWVVVHVGYAIQKIVADDARTTWEMIDEMERVEMPGRHA